MRISDWSSDVCSSDLQPRISIEADFGALADAHVGEVGFLEIGFDPRMRGIDQCDGGQSRDHHLADLQPVRLRDASRARRTHRRPVEIHLRLRPLDARGLDLRVDPARRSEEHTSELQSLMRISYAVFCLKQKKTNHTKT